MKYMYKTLLFLLFVPLTLLATERGKYTKNKVIKKEYTVNKNATFKVDNKYGNIDIVSSNSNKIFITVSITTNGNDEEKVERRLEQIDVDFDASSSFVSAKTEIEKHSNSWSWFGKNNNINIEVNYKISLPVTNNLEVYNDYGNVNLDKIEGKTKFNVDYGKINLGELLNSENNINIDYTNNSQIDFMKDGAINADYSTLHLERSGRTKLNADYSKISFGMVVDLDFNCDYGSLTIDNAGNANGNTDYLKVSIGKLSGSGDFSVDYGGISINDLGPQFKKLKIDAEYAGVKVGVNNNANFNIIASSSYGSIKYGDGFTFNKQIKENSSKYYEGYFGTENSGSSINLKTSYGNITLKN
ncbi:hypothetical protein SAMN05444411_10466 [Lutibacter oricola]|uniref:Adhesin n=1 Tax=Lutibacter oricola TaxID=762486 RepID=A0A1H3A9Y1_9FLAO|nr:hypothetical protein [Lutibacter oricola]SDX26365.1 hypothetical protein SAMN05444411_10466 [Lutibacter oricola]